MNKEELWQALLAQIQFNISKASFATWFKGTNIISAKDGEIMVSVPNNFSKEWLENKYNKIIFKILHNLDGGVREVKYNVLASHAAAPEIQSAAAVSDNAISSISQLDFPELKVDKETNLNPRYTFDSFIVGPFNELAHAAALAIVRSPGQAYNPLFVYGGVGLGKTHLVQSIGNEIFQKFPEKKIRYMSSEKFTSGIVDSIKNHDIEKFKSFYKNIDLLIIDDIQFLAGKEKTQEEFFHIFNNLYEKNKQIVISSDRPPKAISALEERLRSRFEGGMIADISLPDLETRVAILKAKAQEKKSSFSAEIIEYIATNIQRNIRELEGALNRINAYQKLNNRAPDIETTKMLLKNAIFSPKKIINPEKIVKATAFFFDLKEADLIDVSRKKEIVKPRQVAMYLLRNELKCSFPFIGRKFGGKDHTTAIHAYNKIAKELEKDENLAEEISLIKEQACRL
ncbi:MAG: chromosomal replication initiator protein DnaA [Candidatus Nealsonbacteria bacterium]|nr:chromosomal replication initiator protein DnaA [Candidatus Nealsonbacteria bacterium]